jgi:hypothetical protein
MLSLVNVVADMENGRLVLRVDRFSQVGPSTNETVMLLNLKKNISWSQYELSKN